MDATVETSVVTVVGAIRTSGYTSVAAQFVRTYATAAVSTSDCTGETGLDAGGTGGASAISLIWT